MKTVFLIDGFNVYHSIKALKPKFHWLNYYAYCEHFLNKNDEVSKVYLFTAETYWKPDAVKRHRVFLEVCKAYGVEVVLGKFKKKDGYCPICQKKSLHHEEKYTDVNIALTSYREAKKTEVEQIIFVTGDTDLTPAIIAIKEDFPSKKVGVVFPFKKYNDELQKLAHFHHKTNLKALESCIMPFDLTLPNGRKVKCPSEWCSD